MKTKKTISAKSRTLTSTKKKMSDEKVFKLPGISIIDWTNLNKKKTKKKDKAFFHSYP